MNLIATAAAQKFTCLQANCPDTCCKGWSMQLDDATFAKYKTANLENTVAYDGDVRVMKRDPKTDFCVKFQDGICSIHAQKGADFLGDACNSYPRVTRNLGTQTVMTLTMSCPEALRLMLEEDQNLTATQATRLPATLKNWLDDKISAADAITIHQRFLAECAENITAAQLMARIYSVATSLNNMNKADWADATNFMFKIADSKIATPEKKDSDLEGLLMVFLGILHATGKPKSQRLEAVLNDIAKYLGVAINYETLELTPNFTAPNQNIRPDIDAILKKYIAAQLSFTTFPFAGIGDNLKEKAQVLAFKFCLTRLALQAFDGAAVDCIQPLARIIDHIADARLSLSLMQRFGWQLDSRLMGLVFN